MARKARWNTEGDQRQAKNSGDTGNGEEHLAMETKSIEEVLVSVWRQVLLDDSAVVSIDGDKYRVKQTARKKLRQVDFQLAGRHLRGLEQNPETKSRWAAMARAGKKVMQFLEDGGYVAVVVDGKVHLYPRRK